MRCVNAPLGLCRYVAARALCGNVQQIATEIEHLNQAQFLWQCCCGNVRHHAVCEHVCVKSMCSITAAPDDTGRAASGRTIRCHVLRERPLDSVPSIPPLF